MFTKLFKSGNKKSEASKPFEGDVEGLWYLDGKAYDLGKFVKMHPGEQGKQVNRVGRIWLAREI
jgi:cytochrome b involved in lipid metabolism